MCARNKLSCWRDVLLLFIPSGILLEPMASYAVYYIVPIQMRNIVYNWAQILFWRIGWNLLHNYMPTRIIQQYWYLEKLGIGKETRDIPEVWMGSTIHVCPLKQESQPKGCEALMIFLSAHQHQSSSLVNYCSSVSWPCLIIGRFDFSCPQLIAAYLISSLQSCFLYDPHKTFYHISITEHFPKVQECCIIFFFQKY